MKPVLSMLAGAALVTVAGTAMAEEPVTLTAGDLDRVTAGLSAAQAVGQSMTMGDVLSETGAAVTTFTAPTMAMSASETSGIAVSFVFDALSASASASLAVIE